MLGWVVARDSYAVLGIQGRELSRKLLEVLLERFEPVCPCFGEGTERLADASER